MRQVKNSAAEDYRATGRPQYYYAFCDTGGEDGNGSETIWTFDDLDTALEYGKLYARLNRPTGQFAIDEWKVDESTGGIEEPTGESYPIHSAQ